MKWTPILSFSSLLLFQNPTPASSLIIAISVCCHIIMIVSALIEFAIHIIIPVIFNVFFQKWFTHPLLSNLNIYPFICFYCLVCEKWVYEHFALFGIYEYDYDGTGIHVELKWCPQTHNIIIMTMMILVIRVNVQFHPYSVKVGALIQIFLKNTILSIIWPVFNCLLIYLHFKKHICVRCYYCKNYIFTIIIYNNKNNVNKNKGSKRASSFSAPIYLISEGMDIWGGKGKQSDKLHE